MGSTPNIPLGLRQSFIEHLQEIYKIAHQKNPRNRLQNHFLPIVSTIINFIFLTNIRVSYYSKTKKDINKTLLFIFFMKWHCHVSKIDEKILIFLNAYQICYHHFRSHFLALLRWEIVRYTKYKLRLVRWMYITLIMWTIIVFHFN